MSQVCLHFTHFSLTHLFVNSLPQLLSDLTPTFADSPFGSKSETKSDLMDVDMDDVNNKVQSDVMTYTHTYMRMRSTFS